jgi:hypothetical protein
MNDDIVMIIIKYQLSQLCHYMPVTLAGDSFHSRRAFVPPEIAPGDLQYLRGQDF